MDITVSAAGSCDAGVVGCCPVQIHCVAVDLRAHRAPVHSEGVVGPAVELKASWTTGLYKNESIS